MIYIILNGDWICIEIVDLQKNCTIRETNYLHISWTGYANSRRYSRNEFFKSIKSDERVRFNSKASQFKLSFLPFDTNQFKCNYKIKSPIKVCHSPTNRYYKGSEDLIPICKKLEEEGLISFNLIENQTHEKVIEQKQNSDIFIDQVHNRGGWGYE